MPREGKCHTDTDSKHRYTSLQSRCCPSPAHPRHWHHLPPRTIPYHPALKPPVKAKSRWNSVPWRGRVGDTRALTPHLQDSRAGQEQPSATRAPPGPRSSARTCGNCGRPAAPRSSSWAGPCRPPRSPARTRTCSWPWRGRGGRAGSPERGRQRWPRPPGSSAA